MRRATKLRYHVFLLTLLLGGTSCASDQGTWGKHASLMPGWKVVQEAAITAASDPNTWIAIAGAVAFGLGNVDKQVSAWAVQETPLFGSPSHARDTSDQLESIARANFLITALLAPSGEGWDGFIHKSSGLALGFASRRINGEITDTIKFTSNRLRPDKSDHYSFPSGHTSNATIYASLATQNVAYLNISPLQKNIWQCSSYTVAGLTAWARVEGQRHYPSDVLVGYALGNFLGAFINQAFINPNVQLSTTMTSLDQGSFLLTYRW